MKIRMPTFRPEARSVLVVFFGAVAALACRPSAMFPILSGHPDYLVGEWVDSAKSTSTDTSLWVLASNGDDRSRHIVLRTGGAQVDTNAHRYGFWYFQGNIADPADRFICFTNRPGRSAPACVPFTLDTIASTIGTRRRLVVHSYRGQHSESDRVLYARGS